MIDPTGHEVRGPDLEPPEPLETQPEAEVPTEVPEESHIASNVCETCQHDNLLQRVGIVYCERCETPFCIHFMSKIDPAYCVDCCSDVQMRKDDVTYVRTVQNEVTGKVTEYRRRLKEIKMDGLDWLLHQRKIYELTDAEEDLAIEYHRNILNLLLADAEQRRNQKVHRNANVKVAFATPSTTTTTSTVKKSTVTSSTKATAQLSALLNSMLQKGMTKEQLAALLSGK